MGTPNGPCGFLSASSRRDSRSGVADRRHPLRRVGRPKPKSPSLCHPSWLVRRSKRLCGSGRVERYALLRTWLKCQSARDQGALGDPHRLPNVRPNRATDVGSDRRWINERALTACRRGPGLPRPGHDQRPRRSPRGSQGYDPASGRPPGTGRGLDRPGSGVGNQLKPGSFPRSVICSAISTAHERHRVCSGPGVDSTVSASTVCPHRATTAPVATGAGKACTCRSYRERPQCSPSEIMRHRSVAV